MQLCILPQVLFSVKFSHNIFLNKMLFGRSTLVGQRPMKSFSSVRLSIRLSVCPFVTKFSQDWIISFSDIVHDS